MSGSSFACKQLVVGSHTNDYVGLIGIHILKGVNFVISDYFWTNGNAANAGAVTWCSGTSGCHGIISSANSLIGTHANDQVGAEDTGMGLGPTDAVQVFDNGNYVINNSYWGDGTHTSLGAVSWCSGNSGCQGEVSADNSLVGSNSNDEIGSNGIVLLPGGNYLVSSPSWANGSATWAGALTWCNGASGCQGQVSEANSLVGSTNNERVGTGYETLVLGNGNYVVKNVSWSNGMVEVGAVTWCSGSGGCHGPVSTSNSLVGSTQNDFVGDRLQAVGSNNYIVFSSWHDSNNDEVGAVTWCDGSTGCQGPISSTNSLVGSQGNDLYKVTAIVLNNNNYVVISPNWNNGSAMSAGAVTWCDGNKGCQGVISATNSLVGTSYDDQIGTSNNTGISPLKDGDYLVSSPNWSNGGAYSAGAVTWCRGDGSCTGPVSAANSLIGTQVMDEVGYLSPTLLGNGSYVVDSSGWHNGSLATGAVTWCPADGGCTGVISAANSLVGSQDQDYIGNYGITVLSSGGFLVESLHWANNTIQYAGALTWCSGTGPCTGAVSASNSLVGNELQTFALGIQLLKNGNYLVISSSWVNQGVPANGAVVTWCSGTSGCVGAVSAANSLVGDSSGMSLDNITELANGNYIVTSSSGDGGASTWCSGASGCQGAISATNSLIGGVGVIDVLDNNNYIIYNNTWNGGQGRYSFLTMASGYAPNPVGPVSGNYSILGYINDQIRSIPAGGWTYDKAYNILCAGFPWHNKITVLKESPTTIASGNWNDPAVWDFGVPNTGSSVVISSGTTVTIQAPGSASQAANDTPAAHDLTILSGGTLTLNGSSLSLAGDLLNQGTINPGNNTLSIGGNFTNQGAFNPGTSTFNFTSSAVQSIDASAATQFYNLTIGPDSTLLEVPQADLFRVQGALTNLGTIRKSQPVSGAGKLSFGLTGVQIQVDTAGGLTQLQVDRIDKDYPSGTSSQGRYNLNTGKYWTLLASSGQAPCGLTMILPHSLASKNASAAVCSQISGTLVCERTGSDSQTVWKSAVSQVNGDWMVGVKIDFKVFEPIIKK